MNELLNQARERLRRARALPIGPARNEQRQIAMALKALAKLMEKTIVGGTRSSRSLPTGIDEMNPDVIADARARSDRHDTLSPGDQ